MATGKQKNKKKKSFANTIMKLTLAAAAVYLIVALVGGRMQMAAMKAEQEELQRQIQQQQEVNAELQAMADSGDVDAYVERMAREILNYAFPDERIFVDMTGK